MTPLPVSSSREAKRFQLWTDLEAAGGSPLRSIPPQAWFEMQMEDRLEEGGTLEVELLRRWDGWTDIRELRVVRVIYDSAVREYRIRDVEEQIKSRDDQATANRGRLTCEAPIFDLGTRGGLVRRVEANGRVRHRFEVLKLPPADHLNLILGGASPYSSGAPDYFAAGTVDPTDPVDMVYDWDTPLSALRELTTSIEGQAELQVRRNGTSEYLIDVRREVGSSAPLILLDPERNLSQFRRTSSSKDQTTRAVPQGGKQGGGEGAVRADMAEAAWQVDSVNSSTITFVPDILNEDGQLVGRYVEKEDGSLTEITASSSPNQITVADASGIQAGDLLRFRENAAGDQLTYLESPSAVSTYGVVPRVVQRSKIPNVDNVVLNPFLDAWTSGSPDNWTVEGGAPVAQNTNALYTRKGGSSARVGDGTRKAQEGEGLRTVALSVVPTSQRPYYSGRVSIWVVSGSVRLELVDVTNGKVWPPPESDQAAVTDEKSRWVEKLGVAPGADFNELGTQDVQLLVTAAENGTEFYLDAAQITNTTGGRQSIFEGRASNRLWQAALDELAVFSEPLSTYELRGGDLTSLDPGRWPDEEVYVGQTARIRVPALGIDFERRVKRIRRNPFDPFSIDVRVESEKERLTRLLQRSERRRREENEDRPGETNRPADPSAFVGFFGERIVLDWEPAKGASRYVIREQGSGTSAVERWENGSAYADVDGTQYVDPDPQKASLDLVMKAVNAAGRPSKGAVEISISATDDAIEEDVEETADTGTVKVTPNWGDTDRTFTIRFWGRPANKGFPGTADQEDTGVAHGGTRSFSEPLPEDHGAAVRYDVIDEKTGLRLVRRVVKFDSNKRPDHSGHSIFRVLDEVFLAHAGDSDWQSLKYDREVGSDPTLSEIRNGVTVSGRQGITKIYTGLQPGEELRVGVLGYSESNASGLETEEPWRGGVERPAVSRSARLRTKKVSAGVRDLFLSIEGKGLVFPVDWKVFKSDATGTPIASGSVSSETEVGPSDDAGLNDIQLPKEASLHFWAEITDATGETIYAFASADRDAVPNAWPVASDFRPHPTIEIPYDADVEKIEVTVPSGKTKTWSGLSGGGRKSYQVGSTTLDDATTESNMQPGEQRGPYVVEVSGGGLTEEVMRRDLHGVADRVVDVETRENDFDSDGTVEARALVSVIRPGESFDIRFLTKQGRGTIWSQAGSATGLSKGDPAATQDVETVEGLSVFIRGKVYEAGHLDDPDHIVDTFGALTFDPGEHPNIESIDIVVLDGSGKVAYNILGDAVDTENVEAEFDFDDSDSAGFSADETDSSGSQSSPSNALSGETSGVVPQGAAGTVRVTLYSEGDQTGNTRVKDVPISRDGPVGTGEQPVAQISYRPNSSGPDTLVFDLDGHPGERGGSLSDIEGQVQVLDNASLDQLDESDYHDGTGTSGWASSGGSNPIIWGFTVPRDEPNYTESDLSDVDLIVFRVRDTSIGSAGDHPKDRAILPLGEPRSTISQAAGVTVTTSPPSEGDPTDKGDGHLWVEVN